MIFKRRSKIFYYTFIFAFIFLGVLISEVYLSKENKHYFLLLDTSASMNNPKDSKETRFIKLKKTIIQDFLPYLDDKTKINIYVFDEGVRALGTYDLGKKEDSQRIINDINNLNANGNWTYAWSSLKHMLSEASRVHYDGLDLQLFMYTDGKDNEPGGPSLDDVISEFKVLKRSSSVNTGLQIFTLGFSFDQDVKDKFTSQGVIVKDVPDAAIIPTPQLVRFRWYPTRPEIGQPVNFINESIPANTRGESKWIIGTEKVITNTAEPEYIFGKDGLFNVTLQIESISTTREINVIPPPAPKANFSIKTPENDWESGKEIIIFDESSGKINEWHWAFGDGNTSDQQHPSHIYNVKNKTEYLISLEIKGPGGEDRIQQTITIKPIAPPIAAFSVKTPDNERISGDAIVFVDESKGSINQWYWDFGDGTASEQQHPTHIYHTKGSESFNVTLKVKGPGGESDQTESISIGEGFTVNFSANRSNSQLPLNGRPLKVKFINKSKGNNLLFEWDFGDNTDFSNEFSPVHEYIRTGTYIVKLNAINQVNGEKISSSPVKIEIRKNKQVLIYVILQVVALAILAFIIIRKIYKSPPKVPNTYKLNKDITTIGGEKYKRNSGYDLSFPLTMKTIGDLGIISHSEELTGVSIENHESGFWKVSVDYGTVEKTDKWYKWGEQDGITSHDVKNYAIIKSGENILINGMPYQLKVEEGFASLDKGLVLEALGNGLGVLSVIRDNIEYHCEEVSRPMPLLDNDIINFGDEWKFVFKQNDEANYAFLDKQYSSEETQSNIDIILGIIISLLPLIYLFYIMVIYQ